MSEIQRLERRSCYECDNDEYGMIEVETCIHNTDQVCCLSESEVGTQRTGVTNWRSHVSTVEIRIRSLNENMCLMPEGEDDVDPYVYEEKAHIAPSMGDDINQYQFDVPVQRSSGAGSTSGIIQVSMTVDTAEAAEDSREGPTLHSKIEFR